MIDGTDGSGKATQTALLVNNLKEAGFRVVAEDFPQYGQKSAALAEEYLNGKFGTAQELGPYIPSIFFAVDRFTARKRITQSLKQGCIVVSNRYTTASMGHQGGKIKSLTARNVYFQWLFDLEYKLFKIPKPDLTLILHMPANVAQKLVDKKGKRKYARGKKRDLHEADLAHLQAAERTYLEIARKFGYSVIDCYRDKQISRRDEIADAIWQEAKKIL